MPVSEYRTQGRGGRGIRAMATKDEDFVDTVFTASTHDYILFFTSKGRVFVKKGYNIPEAGRNARGTNIINIIQTENGEKISAMIRGRGRDDDGYLVFVTKRGTVKRMEQSARRLLLNMFRTGLFDNPYIDVEEAESTVGCPEFMAQGYRQQLASVVMLKNHAGVLPLAKNRRLRLFIPQRRSPEGPNYWRQIIPERIYDPVQRHIVERDFIVAEDAASADAAVVFIESPHSYLMGYDRTDVERGGNGYIPISLQYADYTATDAREHSIAGGDPFEDFTDRSYRGKTAHTINRCDMELVQRTREAMGNRLLIVAINMLNPTVMSEIEPLADAILVGFDVQSQAIMDIVAGHYEPQGRLPFQLPASMSAVERHFEDRPLDMECYRDADGNVYDFAFGMCWGGVLPAPEL